MRISDWSSDVCSADLGARRASDYAPPRHRSHGRAGGLAHRRRRRRKRKATWPVHCDAMPRMTSSLPPCARSRPENPWVGPESGLPLEALEAMENDRIGTQAETKQLGRTSWRERRGKYV